MTRYNLVLDEILTKQNIPLRLQKLNEVLKGLANVRRQHHHELNAIDHTVIEAKRAAKNQCHKLKCGKVQW